MITASVVDPKAEEKMKQAVQACQKAVNNGRSLLALMEDDPNLSDMQGQAKVNLRMQIKANCCGRNACESGIKSHTVALDRFS